MTNLSRVSAPTAFPQFYPLGDAAVVLEFGTAISLPIHHAIRAVCAYLDDHPFAGLLEYVPAFTTLTLYYDPWLLSQQGHPDAYARVVQTVEQLLPHVQPDAPTSAPRLVEIPVCYGGALGPDVEAVARHAQLTTADVIRLHSQAEYVVYMLGFAPGFPYLGGLNEQLATPRRAQPRATVPAGTVGIAGLQTGIYSLPTPGGWQLIGRTPLRLFDAHRSSPSLLRAGDKLRFVPISAAEFAQYPPYES